MRGLRRIFCKFAKTDTSLALVGFYRGFYMGGRLKSHVVFCGDSSGFTSAAMAGVHR